MRQHERLADEASGRWHRAARALSVPPTALSGLVLGGRCVIYGWDLASTATSGLVVTVYDGLDTNGQVLLTIPLAASGQSIVFPSEPGIRADSGLFVNRGGFAVTGNIFVGEGSEIGYGRQRDYAEEAAEAVLYGERDTAFRPHHRG